jgi:cystathionine beta-synthase
MRLQSAFMKKLTSIYINQYFNELNSEAHYLLQVQKSGNKQLGRLHHLVACSGN